MSDASATVTVSGAGAGAGAERGKVAAEADDRKSEGSGGYGGDDPEERKPLLVSSSRMALEVDPGSGAKGGSPERPQQQQAKGTLTRLLGL